MSKSETGQVNTSAAEIYEEFFIPAIFQEWAVKVADEAGISAGQKVLDVACGTGVLTREVLKRVGTDGAVFGLDINEGMLAVAKAKSPEIEWRESAAESIPFEDESFDAVVSQFGLMFFVDKVAAIREMLRVLKSGGQMTVAVWDSLENAVGYKKVVDLLNRLFGKEVASALRSPYSLGDVAKLRTLFEKAGIVGAEIKNFDGKARFPSIESWMFTDVKGWTLADVLDETQYQLLLQEAEQELQPFLTDDKTVSFSHPAHIIRATKL
jgi:ubiquinone/menaquinone biosynthesis C-methylase UbiE